MGINNKDELRDKSSILKTRGPELPYRVHTWA